MSELKYWEMASGGSLGSFYLDASSATATATGLQCGLIDVLADTVFSVLTGTSVNTTTAVNFVTGNSLTGTVKPGLVWPGYGRIFTSIQITQGQLHYYIKRDD